MLAVTSSLHEGRDGRAQLVVRIEGDVSMSTLPKLTDFLNRESAAATSPTVILDIDSVGVLDDAGLGILMGFAGRVRASGRAVAVVASVARLRQRIDETGFDRAVGVASSILDAGRIAR